MRTALYVLIAIFLAVPASAQVVDIAGEWARDNHEDQPHRAPGAELGDYTGLPLNAAARQKARQLGRVDPVAARAAGQAAPRAVLDARTAAQPPHREDRGSGQRTAGCVHDRRVFRPGGPHDLDGRPAASLGVRRAHLGRVLDGRVGPARS